jgi:hypothetical protein
VIDGDAVYLGSLPSSWSRWSGSTCPVFVVHDARAAGGLVEALERQVAVEAFSSAR